MRYAVLILGLIGAGTSGFLGYRWYSDIHDAREVARILGRGTVPEAKEKQLEMDRLIYSSYLLMGGMALGLVGGLFGLVGRGRSAAAILVVASLAPGILEPRSFVFSCPLILAGLLALFVRQRRPAPAPAMAER